MTEKTDAAFLFALIILTIVGLVVSSAAHAEDFSAPRFICSNKNDNCEGRIVRIPDGTPGLMLKFEICKEGD